MKTQRPEDDTVEGDDRRWVRRLQADSNAHFFVVCCSVNFVQVLLSSALICVQLVRALCISSFQVFIRFHLCMSRDILQRSNVSKLTCDRRRDKEATRDNLEQFTEPLEVKAIRRQKDTQDSC